MTCIFLYKQLRLRLEPRIALGSDQNETEIPKEVASIFRRKVAINSLFEAPWLLTKLP